MEKEILIEDMSFEGQGIGKAEGKAIFVKGAVLGDKVKASITKEKKNYSFAEMTEVIEPSPYRIESFCNKCGGCSLKGLSYQGQLKLKEKQVRDKLTRLAGIDNPKVNPIVSMGDPFRYRNKAQFAVDKGKVGFKEEKSHRVVDVDDCLLQSAPAMAAAEALRNFRFNNMFSGMVVKTSMHTKEVMVVLATDKKDIPEMEGFIEDLDDRIYEAGYDLESVVLNQNEKLTYLAGKRTILDSFSGLDFEISPLAFYQVNTVQMEKLYDIAIKYAALTGKEKVLDLYCGVGTIGLLCAKDAKEVLGIEVVKGAVIDANRNAVINGIVNATYICGKAEEELKKIEDKYDVAILDPPRAGCEKDLLDAIDVDRIVYVSCDAATQARDIKYLMERGYEFIEATPVDQFCHTTHVECVALIKRDGSFFSK
ncbi:MAG: 23S rRNA (uracil(1939)-C(5))-methyltransferase RlmD [Clostridia bacterium]|nr:23S rRNA (uracil(1939)-C(5))-methyltransferase RlmD [Clostridia bacterium]